MINNILLSSYVVKLRNSKLRQVIWPIKSYELIKFIPMAILIFVILLNQNIIRGIKDSLIITNIGAEVINFIKLWVEMPVGILFVVIYTKMCNYFTTEQAFRRVVLFFLSYFVLFGFVIFPHQSSFHPSPIQVASYIQTYPHLKWFIMMWSKWTFVIFYVIGELWPIVVFCLLYWQLANKITKTEEAGRFYSFFTLFGQSNLLFSGSITLYFCSSNHFLIPLFGHLSNPTETIMKSLMFIVLISGLICLAIHAFIEYKIIHDPENFNVHNKTAKTLNLGLKESFKIIVNSRLLWLIALIAISYSMSINLIEGLLFAKITQFYVTPAAVMKYQGEIFFFTGCFTLLLTLIGNSIIRSLGWFYAAVTTPSMIGIFGTIFFIAVLYQDDLMTKIGAENALFFVVVIGGIQSVLGKGAKYSLFDVTREMCYITLNNELKIKGKASVDVLGAKVGKSTGAIIQFLALTLFPEAKYEDMAWFLVMLFVPVCLIWIISLKKISAELSKTKNINASKAIS